MPTADAKRAKKPVDRRRRRHPRYRGDFQVSVSHLLGNEYQKIEGHCRDLSVAGISNWLYTQNVYVIEINGVYYLCNASFPGVNLALSFTP